MLQQILYLEVLNYGLFRWPRGLVGLYFRCPRAECLPEIGVDGVVGLPLSLRRRDPIHANVVPLLLPEVLSFEIVYRVFWFCVESEIAQTRLSDFIHLLVVLLCLLLAMAENFVNIFVRDLN